MAGSTMLPPAPFGPVPAFAERVSSTDGSSSGTPSTLSWDSEAQDTTEPMAPHDVGVMASECVELPQTNTEVQGHAEVMGPRPVAQIMHMGPSKAEEPEAAKGRCSEEADAGVEEGIPMSGSTMASSEAVPTAVPLLGSHLMRHVWLPLR